MSIEVKGSSSVHSKSYKFQFADYNSASMVLSNLEIIYNDMIDNNGMQYKILMNDMLEETRKLVPAGSTNNTSIDLFNA